VVASDFFPPGVGPRRAVTVDCKPDLVSEPCSSDEDHSSRPAVTNGLERSDPDAANRREPAGLDGPSSTASLFEFAPEGVYLTAGHPAVVRGLLPHVFTIAAPPPVARQRR